MSAPGSMPRQIPFIIGNEAAERFSFYGMRNILQRFLKTTLLAYLPSVAAREAGAIDVFHTFVLGAYFVPRRALRGGALGSCAGARARCVRAGRAAWWGGASGALRSRLVPARRAHRALRARVAPRGARGRGPRRRRCVRRRAGRRSRARAAA